MIAAVRRDHALLAGGLVIQLVLAGVTWNALDDAAPADAGKSAVFSTKADDVTRVEIVGERSLPDAEPLRVEFERVDDGWILASADGYPTRADKVDELLEQLLALRVGEVIASNRSNHESLRVGGRQYDRRVTIASDGGSETVILGNGQRSSVNVRREGEDDVRVARGTAIGNLRTDARNYVDPEYVAVDKDDLTQIEVTNRHGTLMLRKNENGWTIVDFPSDNEIDEATLATFINNVARMTLQSPVGTDTDPAYGLEAGARVVLAATGDDGSVYADYVIGEAADERSYYAKAEGSEFVVTVPKWGAEQIRDKKIDDFVKKPAS